MLSAKIRSSFQDSDRTYGARRVWHDLLAAGMECGLHAIERLMRRNGLRARPRRRRLPIEIGHVRQRQSRQCARPLLRGLGAQRQMGGGQHLHLDGRGLAVRGAVIDLFSRRVVGWSMSAAMTAELVTDALVRPSNEVTGTRFLRAKRCLWITRERERTGPTKKERAAARPFPHQALSRAAVSGLMLPPS